MADPQRIDIPGVGIVEFPADMSEKDVSAAASKLYDEANQSKSTPPSVAREAGIFARGAAPTASLTTAGALMGAPLGPAGVAAGALAGGVAIPVADALTALYNLAARDDVQLPSAAIEDMMTKLGFPVPESRGERMLQAGGGAVTGATGGVQAAKGLAQTAVSPIVRNVAGTMAAAPKTQIGTAAPSAATAQYVTEATGSPIAGMIAGTAVGTRPGRISQPTTASQLKSQASQIYQRAENAGLAVKPQYVQNIAAKLRQEAFSEGFDPGLHPKVAAVINRLENEGQTPKTLKELENLRRIIRSPEGDFTNPDQQRIASKLVDEYDDLVENISTPNILAGNKDVALDALKDARKVYGQSRRQATIEDLMERAKVSSGQYSQSGMDNAIRVQFAQLAKNKKRLSSFTQEERSQIKAIAEGGGNIEKFLRGVGKFSIRGPVSSVPYLGVAGLSPELGGPFALGGLAVSEGSRRGAEAMRQAAVKRLMDTIATGQVQRNKYTELLPPTAIRGLLSSQYQVE